MVNTWSFKKVEGSNVLKIPHGFMLRSALEARLKH